MKIDMSNQVSIKKAFSMVEVVFSLGIITLAILVLVGLFGSTLKSTKSVIDSDRANSVIHRINTYLKVTPFNTVYAQIAANNLITLYYLSVEDASDTNGKLILKQSAGSYSTTILNHFNDDTVHGSVLVVFLQKSPIETNSLPASVSSYSKGYLPIEVSVFALPDLEPNDLISYISSGQDISNNLQQLFVYSAAITR